MIVYLIAKDRAQILNHCDRERQCRHIAIFVRSPYKCRSSLNITTLGVPVIVRPSASNVRPSGGEGLSAYVNTPSPPVAIGNVNIARAVLNINLVRYLIAKDRAQILNHCDGKGQRRRVAIFVRCRISVARLGDVTTARRACNRASICVKRQTIRWSGTQRVSQHTIATRRCGQGQGRNRNILCIDLIAYRHRQRPAFYPPRSLRLIPHPSQPL